MNEPKVTALAAARDAPLRHCLRVLEPFLHDDTVTEICINEPHQVWIERDEGWQSCAVPGTGLEYLRTLTQLAATYAGRVCDESSPSLSTTLPDGERLQIDLPPMVGPGRVAVTIRKPSQVVMEPAAYDAAGLHDEVPRYSMEHVSAAVLDAMQGVDRELLELRAARRYWEFYATLVKHKRNVVIAGAPGSGKTTLLKTLVRHIPEHERVITIEDAQEIVLPHANQQHFFFGREVTPSQCLHSCLRHKPDRILLGELRDGIAYDYLQSVTSGFPGSLTTIHGGSVGQTFMRLASLVGETPQGRAMLTSGNFQAAARAEVHCVIVIAKTREGDAATGDIRSLRRVVEIGYHADPRFRDSV